MKKKKETYDKLSYEDGSFNANKIMFLKSVIFFIF